MRISDRWGSECHDRWRRLVEPLIGARHTFHRLLNMPRPHSPSLGPLGPTSDRTAPTTASAQTTAAGAPSSESTWSGFTSLPARAPKQFGFETGIGLPSQWERLKNRLVSRCSPHRDGLFSLYSRCQPHLLCGGPMALYCGGRLRPANHRAMSQGGAGREPLCLCARVRVTIRQWHPPTLKTSGNAMVLMYKHTRAL